MCYNIARKIEVVLELSKVLYDRIPVNKFLSKRVVLLREAAGKNRAAMASILNIHALTLMRIEQCKEEDLSVNGTTLKAIASYFNVSEDWIKSEVDDLEDESTKELLLRVKVRTPLVESLTNANINESVIPELAELITSQFILMGKPNKPSS